MNGGATLPVEGTLLHICQFGVFFGFRSFFFPFPLLPPPPRLCNLESPCKPGAVRRSQSRLAHTRFHWVAIANAIANAHAISIGLPLPWPLPLPLPLPLACHCHWIAIAIGTGNMPGWLCIFNSFNFFNSFNYLILKP